jgi:RNA polymerase sigma-70 factor, ECF subfamily
MIEWQAIIEEFGPPVWQSAYRIVGNRADADECLQEAFLAAVTVSRRGPVRSWPALLRRLAVTRAIDCLRRRVRQKSRNGDPEPLSDAVSRQPAPEAVAQEGEQAAQLRWALGRLPERQGQVMCLKYLEEMSYEEIAAELGTSTQHVGVILSRARESLRSLLEERGTDHG